MFALIALCSEEKPPEEEKVPEPVVEQDETEKAVQDELENATKAIRELGEVLRETQTMRRQTVRLNPETIADPQEVYCMSANPV